MAHLMSMKQRRQDQDFSHRCIDYACVLDFTMTTLSRQVFNHLVTMFTFMFRNSPETMIKGRIASQGHIEYFFRSFGAVTILFIEMKLVVDNDAERLKAIAQVIAGCDGELHLTIQLTSSDFGLPVQVVTTKTVLSNGLFFEFFKYEKTPNPSILRGCFKGDSRHLQRGMHVPDFTVMKTALPFIVQLRHICETIFDVMVGAYIAGLKAYRDHSDKMGKKEGSKRPSWDNWHEALQWAEFALEAFRMAEDRRVAGDIKGADTAVEQDGLELEARYFNFSASLRDHISSLSTGAIPSMYKSDLIMPSWRSGANDPLTVERYTCIGYVIKFRPAARCGIEISLWHHSTTQG
jgi:hypothetical protein